MQRSSSQVGGAAQNYQYPWSIKLDRTARVWFDKYNAHKHEEKLCLRRKKYIE